MVLDLRVLFVGFVLRVFDLTHFVRRSRTAFVCLPHRRRGHRTAAAAAAVCLQHAQRGHRAAVVWLTHPQDGHSIAVVCLHVGVLVLGFGCAARGGEGGGRWLLDAVGWWRGLLTLRRLILHNLFWGVFLCGS